MWVEKKLVPLYMYMIWYDSFLRYPHLYFSFLKGNHVLIPSKKYITFITTTIIIITPYQDEIDSYDPEPPSVFMMEEEVEMRTRFLQRHRSKGMSGIVIEGGGVVRNECTLRFKSFSCLSVFDLGGGVCVFYFFHSPVFLPMCFTPPPLSPLYPLWNDGDVELHKRLAWTLFVLLLSTLVCCQPTELISASFLFHKFYPPPPSAHVDKAEQIFRGGLIQFPESVIIQRRGGVLQHSIGPTKRNVLVIVSSKVIIILPNIHAMVSITFSQYIHAGEARRKLCAQSCKANDWVYNLISLLSVKGWMASAKYTFIFHLSLRYNVITMVSS